MPYKALWGLIRPSKVLWGLIRPYPSLSFVEYNSSQDPFFTPLVYFLAGHYLDPWDAGEGGLKKCLSFVFFCVPLCLKMGSKLSPKICSFWFQGWILSFGILVFFGCFLGAFLCLLSFFWEVSVAKNLKKQWFFKVFEHCGFGLFDTPEGSFGVILAPVGMLWS